MKNKIMVIEKTFGENDYIDYRCEIIEKKEEIISVIGLKYIVSWFMNSDFNEISNFENLSDCFDYFDNKYGVGYNDIYNMLDEINEESSVDFIKEIISKINKKLNFLNTKREFIIYYGFNDYLIPAEKEGYIDIFPSCLIHPNYDEESNVYIYCLSSINNFESVGSWVWHKDINLIKNYYKYYIIEEILIMNFSDKFSENAQAEWGVDRLIPDLMNNDKKGYRPIYEKIIYLLEQIDNCGNYEEFSAVCKDINKSLSLLGAKFEFKIFNGTKGIKELVLEHGSEWKESNLYFSLINDYTEINEDEKNENIRCGGMTVDEAQEALDLLVEQCGNEEDVAAALYLMYAEYKLNFEQFEVLLEMIGYEVDEEFKNMKDEVRRKFALNNNAN